MPLFHESRLFLLRVVLTRAEGCGRCQGVRATCRRLEVRRALTFSRRHCALVL